MKILIVGLKYLVTQLAAQISEGIKVAHYYLETERESSRYWPRLLFTKYIQNPNQATHSKRSVFFDKTTGPKYVQSRVQFSSVTDLRHFCPFWTKILDFTPGSDFFVFYAGSRCHILLVPASRFILRPVWSYLTIAKVTHQLSSSECCRRHEVEFSKMTHCHILPP